MKKSLVESTCVRKILVLAIFLVVIGGNLTSLLFRKDPWPFSSYPMYSKTGWEHWDHFEMCGVAIDGKRSEFLLKKGDIPDKVYNDQALLKIAGGIPVRDPERARRLEAAIRTIGLIYESHRVSTGNGRPPIEALRYYRHTFDRDSKSNRFEMIDGGRELIGEAYLEDRAHQ
jgi:hypothetical protein